MPSGERRAVWERSYSPVTDAARAATHEEER